MLYKLEDKLGDLIKAYKIAKENEANLTKKVILLESKISGLEQNVAQLEEALMVKNMSANSDQDALKLYIDSIIAEIELTIKKL